MLEELLPQGISPEPTTDELVDTAWEGFVKKTSKESH